MLEHKRLVIELSMWLDGALMAADVLAKGREKGHVDVLVGLMQDGNYHIRPMEEMRVVRKAKREAKTRWAP